MSDWVCYLIYSVTCGNTYIGASNNAEKRLRAHNGGKKGAKRTRGNTWLPLVIISGFESKNACLSFESGWKRLWRTRNNSRLWDLSMITQMTLKYNNDAKWNRILDLLYFVYNTTYIGHKFMMNDKFKHPIIIPPDMTLNIFNEEAVISSLAWPYFMETNII